MPSCYIENANHEEKERIRRENEQFKQFLQDTIDEATRVGKAHREMEILAIIRNNCPETYIKVSMMLHNEGYKND